MDFDEMGAATELFTGRLDNLCLAIGNGAAKTMDQAIGWFVIDFAVIGMSTGLRYRPAGKDDPWPRNGPILNRHCQTIVRAGSVPDRCETAMKHRFRVGYRTGGNICFICLICLGKGKCPRHVNVRIDKTRHKEAAFSIDHGLIGSCFDVARRNFSNSVALNPYCAVAGDDVPTIENLDVIDQD